VPEVLGVSHRMLTMTEGRISGSFTGDRMTEQALIDAVSQPV
jgi:ribose transport system ATP-binding protein